MPPMMMRSARPRLIRGKRRADPLYDEPFSRFTLPTRMTNLPLNYLAPDFAVASQLAPEQMQALAASGFRSVVNNRLEREPGQPPEDALRAAAAASNLEYERLPVDSGHITIDDVARFAELIERLPRPIVAFCRSGSRSGILYRAALEGVHRR